MYRTGQYLEGLHSHYQNHLYLHVVSCKDEYLVYSRVRYQGWQGLYVDIKESTCWETLLKAFLPSVIQLKRLGSADSLKDFPARNPLSALSVK